MIWTDHHDQHWDACWKATNIMWVLFCLLYVSVVVVGSFSSHTTFIDMTYFGSCLWLIDRFKVNHSLLFGVGRVKWFLFLDTFPPSIEEDIKKGSHLINSLLEHKKRENLKALLGLEKRLVKIRVRFLVTWV